MGDVCSKLHLVPYNRTPTPERPAKAYRLTTKGVCTIKGCKKKRFARGWCSNHWYRWRTYGDPLLNAERVNTGKQCKLAGCTVAASRQQYCSKHYRKFLKYGDPLAGRTVTHDMGEGSYMSSGYRRLYLPEHPNADRWGSVGEHVVVMTEIIGRPLYKGETVHHKNGVRDDNRQKNLELWVKSQPAGQRPEDLVEWAHEILDRYEGIPLRDAS